MVLRELVLICPQEPAVADDLLATDEEAIDSVRAGEDETGDGIIRAAELEAVGPPDGEIRSLAG
jgi:hypothetical protein